MVELPDPAALAAALNWQLLADQLSDSLPVGPAFPILWVESVTVINREKENEPCPSEINSRDFPSSPSSGTR